MIAMRENAIEASGHRITRSDFCKRKRTKKTNDCTTNPRHKKYFGYSCFVSHFNRRAKDSHPNNETYHNHGKIKQTEFGFNRHGREGFRCLIVSLKKTERVHNQNKYRWVLEPLTPIEKLLEDYLLLEPYL